MNIASLLTSIDQPDRPALILPNGTDGSSVTFRELDAMTARMATGFQHAGLQTGARVIVLAPISLNLYAALIALFRLGAAAVFLDPQAGFRQLDRAAALTEADGFIGSRKALWLKWLSPSLRRIPLTWLADGDGTNSLTHLAKRSLNRQAREVRQEEQKHKDSTNFLRDLGDLGDLSGSQALYSHATNQTEIADVAPEAPALITFTGGSTGADGPRGVSRTHRLLASQHAALSDALPTQPGDVDMPAFPVATLHNMAAGVPSVIPDYPFRKPQAVRAEKILAQIAHWGVTTASGSPAYWWAIAEYCVKNKLSLPLRRIVTGGAPVAPDLITWLHQIAPQAEILCVYGSTEAEPVAVISGAQILNETAALTANGAGIPLGIPVSQVALRVLDENQQEQGTGQVGEIWVSGEHVARSYFANPQADAYYKKTDGDGRLWHRMGDLGYLDVNGLLWLAGRVHTKIIRDGKTIYPVPVEAMVAMLSFVHRAALTGNRDGRTCLTVELAVGAPPPADWQAQLQSLCAAHGWPIDRVRRIRNMPVDARHNARIDYKRLKQK